MLTLRRIFSAFSNPNRFNSIVPHKWATPCLLIFKKTYTLNYFTIIFFLWKFFTSALADGFYWSQCDGTFSQVSSTLLSILTDLNNAVVWMVSTRPLISKSSTPCTNPLVTVPNISMRKQQNPLFGWFSLSFFFFFFFFF